MHIIISIMLFINKLLGSKLYSTIIKNNYICLYTRTLSLSLNLLFYTYSTKEENRIINAIVASKTIIFNL
jgi:hypothetical protein